MSPRPARANGSVTPPTDKPSPASCFRRCTAAPTSPRTSSAFQSTASSVLDTTYFFVASMASAKGISYSPIQSGHLPEAGRRHAVSIIS